MAKPGGGASEDAREVCLGYPVNVAFVCDGAWLGPSALMVRLARWLPGLLTKAAIKEGLGAGSWAPVARWLEIDRVARSR